MVRIKHRDEVYKILDIFGVNQFDATDRMLEDIDDVFDELYANTLNDNDDDNDY